MMGKNGSDQSAAGPVKGCCFLAPFAFLFFWIPVALELGRVPLHLSFSPSQ